MVILFWRYESFKVHIPSIEVTNKIVVRFILPKDYPRRQAPRISIVARHLSKEEFSKIEQTLSELYQPGNRS